MADIKEYTKERLKPVTSGTKRLRQNSNAAQNTADGAKLPTDANAVTSEKIRDLLARLKDVTHSWPCRLPQGKMPAPFISSDFILFAFPLGGHVIQNAVTSNGEQNFNVDGILVIPVTSDSVQCSGGGDA